MSAEPVRLVLSEDQSAFLRDAGVKFAVVSPGSYPESTGRFCLTLIECSRDSAIASIEVAQGLRRSIKPKQPKP